MTPFHSEYKPQFLSWLSRPLLKYFAISSPSCSLPWSLGWSHSGLLIGPGTRHANSCFWDFASFLSLWNFLLPDRYPHGSDGRMSWFPWESPRLSLLCLCNRHNHKSIPVWMVNYTVALWFSASPRRWAPSLLLTEDSDSWLKTAAPAQHTHLPSLFRAFPAWLFLPPDIFYYSLIYYVYHLHSATACVSSMKTDISCAFLHIVSPAPRTVSSLKQFR